VKRTALTGIVIAIIAIVGGLYLDGGTPAQLLQPTAALIVFGGTLGAVLVQFPADTLRRAFQYLRLVFLRPAASTTRLTDELLRYAGKARRSGLVSLDAELDKVSDPFLRKCLTLAVDGVHAPELRHTMELALDLEAEEENCVARVFEAAGGFAPTIGILGAVIGLIQVMQHLGDLHEVGRGIAAAFVATIYGVGFANLFLLPCAGRVRRLVQMKQTRRELMLEGVLEIVERTGPTALEAKLSLYLHESPRPRPVAVGA
jgi:chemotaxis protein MotA